MKIFFMQDQFHDHRADLQTDVLGQVTERGTAPFKDGNNWFHKSMWLLRLTCCEAPDFVKLQAGDTRIMAVGHDAQWSTRLF